MTEAIQQSLLSHDRLPSLLIEADRAHRAELQRPLEVLRLGLKAAQVGKEFPELFEVYALGVIRVRETEQLPQLRLGGDPVEGSGSAVNMSNGKREREKKKKKEEAVGALAWIRFCFRFRRCFFRLIRREHAQS